jgi:carboxymethylenebutenolidase
MGGKDAMIPMAAVDGMRDALKSAGTRHEVIVYDADHGFFCNARGSYDKASAEDAWTRVKSLFASELR